MPPQCPKPAHQTTAPDGRRIGHAVVPLSPSTSMRIGTDVASTPSEGLEDGVIISPPQGAKLDDPKTIDFTTIKAKLLTEETVQRLWRHEDVVSKIALLDGFGALAERSNQIRLGRLDLNSTRYELDMVLDQAGDIAVEASRLGTRWRDVVVRAIKGDPDEFADVRLAAARAASKMAKAGCPMIQAAEAVCQASKDRDRRVQDEALEGLLVAEEWAERIATSRSFGRSTKVWGVEGSMEDRATPGLGMIFKEEIRVALCRLKDRDAPMA